MNRFTRIRERGLPVAAWAMGLLFATTLLSTSALAGDSFHVEIRVIEAVPGAGAKTVDPKLSALRKDLLSLPFREYKLREQHAVNVAQGKRVDFEFPGARRKTRFLSVTAHGVQRGGKLRFQLTIEDLKFDTLVAVPDRGTILVGGPRNGRNTLLFAVTARQARKTAAATARRGK